jgi:hypothetical protein
LRFAARAFGKRAGFAAVAIVTALGIAAATTVFSIVDARTWAREVVCHASRLVEFQSHAQTLENISVDTWATNIGRVLMGAGPSREVLTVPAWGLG